jgi:MinD-like ATPase involved in chromosome partitioning or flagellar assembly
MGEVIAFHSFKGGSGKTVVASNVAFDLASRVNRVVLLDFDFKAPSLYTVFHPKKNPKYWLNDWYLGNCSILETLIDVSDNFGLPKHRLEVGFADLRGESLKKSFQEQLASEAQASFYGHIMGDVNNTLLRTGVDYVLLDTSPGFTYASLVAILSCERLILVTRTDDLDLQGTVELIKTVYDAVLRKKVLLVVNHAPPQISLNPSEEEKLREEISSRLKMKITALIPCYCDLVASRGRGLIACENPEHGFSKSISTVAERLVRREAVKTSE